jgi:hypothetical protein
MDNTRVCEVAVYVMADYTVMLIMVRYSVIDHVGEIILSLFFFILFLAVLIPFQEGCPEMRSRPSAVTRVL